MEIAEYKDWSTSEDLQEKTRFGVHYAKFRRIKYYENPLLCPECGVIISYQKWKDRSKFCSHSCSAKTSNRNRANDPNYNHDEKVGKKLREGYKIGKYKPKPHKTKAKPPTRWRGVPINRFAEEKTCPCCGKNFTPIYRQRKKIYCSRECWDKSAGGARKGSGIGRCGTYREYQFQSSWEFFWLVYALDHGIDFKRNTIGFPYSYLGKMHLFYPDFILPDGSYLEIKGFIDSKNKVKIEEFVKNQKLIIIGKKEIGEYINYVKVTYGENFIDNFSGKKRTKICKYCGNSFFIKGPKVFCNNSCSIKYRYSVGAMPKNQKRGKSTYTHGELGKYQQGCRCDACRKANAQSQKEYREKNIKLFNKKKREYYHRKKALINKK